MVTLDAIPPFTEWRVLYRRWWRTASSIRPPDPAHEVLRATTSLLLTDKALRVALHAHNVRVQLPVNVTDICRKAIHRVMQPKKTDVLWFAAALMLIDEKSPPRRAMALRARIHWDREFNMLLCEGEFEACYRMSPGGLELLTRIVSPSLNSTPHSWCFRDPITPINKIQVTLRFLGGGSGHDIRRVSGMGRATFYRVVWEVVGAINAHPRLRISFPVSPTEREAAAASFKALSTGGIFTGCVACLDGWLCRIQAPSMKETEGTGPRPYFSGHYTCFGINAQACCDSFCRITYLDISNPGSCNDARGLSESALAETIENLERGFYVIADNAYPCTQRLLTPFVKNQTTNRYKDAYNFYVSQLRIRIEMTFGLLKAKWQIFARPLRVGLTRCPEVIMSASILHNFVIEQRLHAGESFDPVAECIALGLVERPGMSVESILGFTPSDPALTGAGSSHLRDAMVDRIKMLNLLRVTMAY